MCSRLRPHQLDFDWRFTQQTAHELTSVLRGRRSLIMGCPTVAEALGSRGSQAVLIDRQPAVTCKFSGQAIQADLRREIESFRVAPFESIIFDAPWYPEDLLIWLDFALVHSTVDTEVYFSLWPDHTRPTAELEASAVLEQASLRGHIEIFRENLRYETPGFEHISTQGVGNEWRSGDLVRLVVQLAEPLHVWKPKLRPSWHRFALGDYQIAIRLPDKSKAPPSISPIFGSWFLPSVSRRQGGLDRIGIWTSDNRVGALEGGEHVYRALHALVRGEESDLYNDQRSGIKLLREAGFVPTKLPERRIEWEQFD